MKNTIAGVTLILASLVCVVLFVHVEYRPPRFHSAGNTWGTGDGTGAHNTYMGYMGGGYGCSFPTGCYGYPNWWCAFPPYEEYLPPVVLPDPNDESVRAIYTALACRDIRLNIDDTTTFHDLFLMIKNELRRLELPDIHIAMDIEALQHANEIRSDTIVYPHSSVLLAFPSMRLHNMLSNLLEPHELDYTIRNESLLITTKNKVLAEGEDKWNREQQDKAMTAWEDMCRKSELAAEQAYHMSMRTHKMLLTGLAIAWLAYFLTGLCLLLFAREKRSPEK